MRTDRIVLVAIVLGLTIWAYLLLVWNPWSRSSKNASDASTVLSASSTYKHNPEEVWIEVEQMSEKEYRSSSQDSATASSTSSAQSGQNADSAATSIGTAQPGSPSTGADQMVVVLGGDNTGASGQQGTNASQASQGSPLSVTGSDASAAGTAFKKHVIQKGETPSAIAQKYLGSANRWKDICDANPGLNPKRLKIGESLNIPIVEAASREIAVGAGNQPIPASDASAGRNTEADASSKGNSGSRVYVVSKGDSLGRISKKFYGNPDNWRRIAQANPSLLRNPNALRPGMEIRIP